MNKKVLGCLLGAAVGDAMGAATETKSTRQIERTFGGAVREFKTPPQDTLARGRRADRIFRSICRNDHQECNKPSEKGCQHERVGLCGTSGK